MSSVCQAFVADASDDARRAINLGTFQGLSIGGAFVVAFPLGGLLGAKLGTRAPVLLAAGVQLLNFLLIAFVTPESKPASERAGARLDLRRANPAGALARLFCAGPVLRGLSAAYFLVTLSRGRARRAVPELRAVQVRLGAAGVGPAAHARRRDARDRAARRRAAARAAARDRRGRARARAATRSPRSRARPPRSSARSSSRRSAARASPRSSPCSRRRPRRTSRARCSARLGSIQELCGALGNPAYARLFAYFISDAAPLKLPGAHFVFASALMIACFAVSRRTFRAHEGEIVLPKFD